MALISHVTLNLTLNVCDTAVWETGSGLLLLQGARGHVGEAISTIRELLKEVGQQLDLDGYLTW